VPDANRDELQDPKDVARRLAAWLAEGDVRNGTRVKLANVEVRT